MIYNICAGCELSKITLRHMFAKGELWAIYELARELPDVWFVATLMRVLQTCGKLLTAHNVDLKHK